MSSTPTILSILLSFFTSLIGSLEADLNIEMGWFGGKVSLLMYIWAESFTGFGPLIPALLVSVTGITIAGLLVVFVFLSGAKDVVG
jgi:hypothetical protein